MTTAYAITFLPSNRTVTVAAGTTLMQAARDAGLHINASCAGAALCGKCRVIVEAGEVNGGRTEKLSEADYSLGVRQACCATVMGAVTVRIPQESGISGGALATAVPERHRPGPTSFTSRP